MMNSLVCCRRLAPGLLILGALLAGCAPKKSPIRVVSDLKAMATDAETELGRITHPEILDQYGRYDDEVLQGYVQRIGEQLVIATFGAQRILRFVVLDSDEVNAFSIPGGYIYITRGLVGYLNSEAELAAVLAHEIAHVTQRHAAHHLLETEVPEAELVVGSIVINELRAQPAIDLFKSMGHTLLAGYEADEEIEASRLGASLLAAAGYNPAAMIETRSFLRRHAEFDRQLAGEQNRGPRTYHAINQLNPDTESRLAEVVANTKFKTKADDEISFIDRFYNTVDGLVWGGSTLRGIVTGRQLINPEWGIGVAAPEGWRSYNQATRVTWVPASQDAYIRLQTYPMPENSSPQDFLRTQLELQEIAEVGVYSPNGFPGYTATARMRTAFGPQRGRVFVIFANDRVFVFQFAARSDTIRAYYNDAYSSTVGSFRPLTADDRSKMSPRHLKVVVVDKGATFESLVQKSSNANRVRDQLRLLNQLYPSGQLRPGQHVKTID